MVGKGGWLRIVEASIAVLIILSVLFIIAKQNVVLTNESEGSDNFGVLDKMALNNSMRALILSYDAGANESEVRNAAVLIELKKYAQNTLPIGFGSRVKICQAVGECIAGESLVDVLTEERIISANDTKIVPPRKVMISYWQE